MIEEHSIELLKEIVKVAVDQVYNFQYYLIKKNVNERSIQHYLAVYLSKIIKNIFTFPYNIDVEYNRNIGSHKDLNNNGEPNYPDIIVHHRGDNKFNLIYIEIKKDTKNDKNDFRKLRYSTGYESDFTYNLGVFINFEKENPKYTWFINGKSFYE